MGHTSTTVSMISADASRRIILSNVKTTLQIAQVDRTTDMKAITQLILLIYSFSRVPPGPWKSLKSPEKCLVWLGKLFYCIIRRLTSATVNICNIAIQLITYLALDGSNCRCHLSKVLEKSLQSFLKAPWILKPQKRRYPVSNSGLLFCTVVFNFHCPTLEPSLIDRDSCPISESPEEKSKLISEDVIHHELISLHAIPPHGSYLRKLVPIHMNT